MINAQIQATGEAMTNDDEGAILETIRDLKQLLVEQHGGEWSASLHTDCLDPEHPVVTYVINKQGRTVKTTPTQNDLLDATDLVCEVRDIIQVLSMALPNLEDEVQTCSLHRQAVYALNRISQAEAMLERELCRKRARSNFSHFGTAA